jgi:hypothetical protein
VKWNELRLIILNSLSSRTVNGKESEMQKKAVKGEEINIRIGSNSFAITLLDNKSTKRLKETFPLTIRMKDLHGNEKYFDLPNDLPTNASNPKSIKAGDFMLYGSNTLVVFYKSFPTSYSYTRLGRVNNPSKLESTLGPGDVTLTFEKHAGSA